MFGVEKGPQPQRTRSHQVKVISPGGGLTAQQNNNEGGQDLSILRKWFRSRAQVKLVDYPGGGGGKKEKPEEQ